MANCPVVERQGFLCSFYFLNNIFYLAFTLMLRKTLKNAFCIKIRCILMDSSRLIQLLGRVQALWGDLSLLMATMLVSIANIFIIKANNILMPTIYYFQF